MDDPDECSVQVALRVRPMMGAEKEGNCRSVIRAEGTQIFIGTENPRPFTFDYVFDQTSDQKHVYAECVSSLVRNYLEGYNATILAYGQTGSGKTHTMGTACNEDVAKENFGILPRVIDDIFDLVDNDTSHQFKVSVQFLEIHNQDINDLLVVSPFVQKGKKSEIAIREQPNGEIIVTGVTEHQVQTREEMMACLDRGSTSRTTGSTKMNAVSSRSHAIFTVFLTQKTVTAQDESSEGPLIEQEENIITSKFHFVDLAGSERLKRTGATGERREEGISINGGLLALGNVISALADKRGAGHVPFRDSKITRLLQDSLGGNSKTLMIACVSPAEINEEETVSTLKYANRARNIKNKVVINRDPNLVKLDKMRARIVELEEALRVAGVPVPDGVAVSTPCPTAVDRSATIHALQRQNELYIQENARLASKVYATRLMHEDTTRKLLTVENQLLLYKQGVASLEGGKELVAQLECAEVPASELDDFKLVYMQQRKITQLKEKMRALREEVCVLKGISPTRNNTSIGSETSEQMSDASEVSDEPDDDSEQQLLKNDLQLLRNADAQLTFQLEEKEDAYRVLSEARLREMEWTTKITEMEAEVERVQLEKERALKELEKNINDSKYKEQVSRQSKQLTDLRAQIQQLREKLKESESIKRDYERKGLQLKQLQTEIEDVKRQRVKLAKEITEKSEAHREAMKAQENAVKRMVKETRTAKLDMQKYKEMLTKKESVLKRETEKNLFLQKQIQDQETKRRNARMQRASLQQALQAQALETPARKRRADQSPKRKPAVAPAIPDAALTPKRRGTTLSKQKSSLEPSEIDDLQRLNKQLEETLAQQDSQFAELKKQNDELLLKVREYHDDPEDPNDNEADSSDEAAKYKSRYTKLSKRLVELQQRERVEKLELEKCKNELIVAQADIQAKAEKIAEMEKREGKMTTSLADAVRKDFRKREQFFPIQPNPGAGMNKENSLSWFET